MGTLLQDLRFGLRSLRKRPGLTLVAVLSLGLAIGANSTVFTWLNTFVLRPLPAVPEYGRIVAVQTHAPGDAEWSISYPSLKDWRAQSRSMDLASASFGEFGLRGETGASVERVWGGVVSGNYFRVLRVAPVLGRLLTMHDEEQRTPVVVLGYSFWKRRFAGDSGIVGRTITLNQEPLTVVGIAAPRFGGTTVGLRWDLFVPVTLGPLLHAGGDLTDRENEWMDGVGRLNDGWSLARAQAELDGVAKRVAAANADADARNGAYVKPMSDEGAGQFMRPVLVALLAVTGLVLLIACANVGSLLLARAVARRREIGIRIAIGAGRARLIRQLLTESVALAALAGLVGIGVTFWARDTLSALIPPSPYPISIEYLVSAPVLLFTLGITLVAVLAFGLAPAVQTSAPELVPALKDGVGGPVRRSRLQNGLVVAQVALSLVSLVCAGLFLRSLEAARHTDVGIESPEHVLLVSTDLQLAGVPESLRVAVATKLLDNLRALPGVSAASLMLDAPLGFGGYSSSGVEPDGYVAQRGENMSVEYEIVGSDFFRAFGIPLVEGRGITAQDLATSEKVAVVNQRFVSRFWPGQDPIGRQFKQGGTTWTVVGVAKQGKYHDLDERAAAMTYVPLAQHPTSGFDVIVRSSGDPSPLAPALKRAFQATDADLPFLDVRTMAEHMQAALFGYTIGATMLAAFGALALLLSAIGIYGIMAYTVSQRTREIGLRVALGAARRDVVRMVIGRAMRLAGLGLAIGLVAALGAGRMLRSMLLGVSGSDPLTFAAIGLLLAAVALAASWLPARRAARIDPMVALRYE